MIRDAEIELIPHPEHGLVEAEIEQGQHRQSVWVAALTGLDGEYGYEREFVAYCNPGEDSASDMVPVGHGSVFEAAESGAVEADPEKQYFWYDRQAGCVNELPEDEVEDAVRDRLELLQDE